MRKLRVRDLEEWPPEPSGAFERGDVLRVAPSEAILSKLYRHAGRRVTFGCTCERESYTYDLEAPTEKIAEQLAALILKNIGKPLISLGEFEIEEK